MSVKMKPTGVIKARLGINPGGDVQRFFTHTCRMKMEEFVPYGISAYHLRENVEEGKDYVKYKSPYAHYMYMGILYVDPETKSSWARKDVTKVPTNRQLTYHTPGTGAYWDKRMVSAKMDEVLQEVEDYIRRR